ncbi:TIGR04282 family arsenosugar biosynthesis glycosyltransferase [Patulibacter defluvii]|uniref:TIGR04282 family arsenosugar biosynthesis glycosyltransferase n=1 Tax=Patulibacter defluvii TaxID=3095358 RepID=UPI002A75A8C8|nr:TIGR04282 family arsenosugar biosynthesis glycosyltransferase [Patulibacter sp. DM4]
MSRPLPALAVIAKAPVAGRSKTRLCPPCTPVQAARLAAAALADTLATVAATPAGARVLVLDGEPGPWCSPAMTVIPQRGDGLDERLAAAFEDVAGPALVIGMDTPQVRPALLSAALRRLTEPAVDAVLGPADDGGYWALGLRRADRALLEGVPMSVPETGAAQRRRLAEAGLTVAELPTLRDVDRFADARAVAALAPGGRFARAVHELDRRPAATSAVAGPC